VVIGRRTRNAVTLDEVEEDGVGVHPVAEEDLVLYTGRGLLLLVAN
jgi:hypothetical protein